MKNKLTFLLICGIAMMMAACSGSSNGKPMLNASYRKIKMLGLPVYESTIVDSYTGKPSILILR